MEPFIVFVTSCLFFLISKQVLIYFSCLGEHCNTVLLCTVDVIWLSISIRVTRYCSFWVKLYFTNGDLVISFFFFFQSWTRAPRNRRVCTSDCVTLKPQPFLHYQTLPCLSIGMRVSRWWGIFGAKLSFKYFYYGIKKFKSPKQYYTSTQYLF